MTLAEQCWSSGGPMTHVLATPAKGSPPRAPPDVVERTGPRGRRRRRRRRGLGPGVGLGSVGAGESVGVSPGTTVPVGSSALRRLGWLGGAPCDGA